MRFLCPAVSVVAALALFVGGGLAHADPEPASPSTPTLTPASPTLSPDSSKVFVHLEAPRNVRLEARDPDRSEDVWSLVCDAPCDRILSPRLDYRVSVDGSRERPSRSFDLAGGAGQRETVTVSFESKTPTAGIVVVVLGASALAFGLGVFIDDLVEIEVCGANASLRGCNASGALTGAGAVSAVAGAIVLVTGILMIATRDHFHVMQAVLDLLPPKPPIVPDTASLRTPMWRDSGKDVTAGAAKVGVPIFSHNF
jgi:hypothetical protein